ncbi:MAG TPA: SAM-dependent chlorinase/fluorinase [Vicinamibacterales bacterium]|nr:SAM-dependent chlorinase/fluorinase [Vicinamibacterales bacterium]
MARPLIALLTDFGTADHYVGAMKGVVLTICPDATLVDISHDVPPHDIMIGALELAACYRYFPPNTIFLVVVDPGVGSSRCGLAAEAGDYRFVAPDNGVLTAVFAETKPKRIVQLTERRYARPTLSRTFEGRDRFAPAAAWLAKGIDCSALGRPVSQIQQLHIPVPTVEGSRLGGEVMRIDRFGNLVSNIDRRTFDTFRQGGPIRVEAGLHEIARVVGTYAEIEPGAVAALFGSTDHLEVACNGASAAERLRLRRGDPIRVIRSA